MWTVPATATNGVLTAAFWNTEVRDHDVWLKAALDLITGSTAADSGTQTELSITRTTSAQFGFSTRVSGDTVQRFGVTSAGALGWGSGAAAIDVSLYREAARVLMLDNAQFRSYRAAFEDPAYSARVTGDTTSRFAVYGGGFFEMIETGATIPATPAADTVRIYCRDNGAGKTQLVAKWSDGTLTSIALQA